MVVPAAITARMFAAMLLFPLFDVELHTAAGPPSWARVSRRAGKAAYHVESPALPPVGIAPGGVHGRFETAGKRLAELVAGHQQPLALPPAAWNSRCLA